MKLTESNYFSTEASMEYMGASQFKDFEKCQSLALAKIKGEFVQEKTDALLVGSYVDAHFSKSLDLFKLQNPEIFLKGKSELKQQYKNADEIIQRLERDNFFMSFMGGEVQVIKTGTIAGVKFKIKIDNYYKGEKIVDLKIVRDFEKMWKDGLPITFIENWGYDLQGAIYQEVVCDETFERLPFYLACATKEKEPDLMIIDISQDRLDYKLDYVREYAPFFDKIKKGEVAPTRCEECDYCKRTKVLSKVISMEDLLQ